MHSGVTAKRAQARLANYGPGFVASFADWVPGPLMPGNMVYGKAFSTNGKIYVFGQPLAGSRLQSGYIYTPGTSLTSGLWTTTSSSPGPYTYSTGLLDGQGFCLLADGRIFVMMDSTPQVSSCQIYDPVANTWTVAAAPPHWWKSPRPVTMADGRVCVSSGAQSTGFGSTGWGGIGGMPIDIYDPSLDSWSTAVSKRISEKHNETATVSLISGKVSWTGGPTISGGVFDTARDTWDPGSDTIVMNNAPFNLAGDLAHITIPNSSGTADRFIIGPPANYFPPPDRAWVGGDTVLGTISSQFAMRYAVGANTYGSCQDPDGNFYQFWNYCTKPNSPEYPWVPLAFRIGLDDLAFTPLPSTPYQAIGGYAVVMSDGKTIMTGGGQRNQNPGSVTNRCQFYRIA